MYYKKVYNDYVGVGQGIELPFSTDGKFLAHKIDETEYETLKAEYESGYKVKLKAKEDLRISDSEFIRGIDDLIDVLIDKNLIKVEDLPSVLKNKKDERKILRNKLK